MIDEAAMVTVRHLPVGPFSEVGFYIPVSFSRMELVEIVLNRKKLTEEEMECGWEQLQRVLNQLHEVEFFDDAAWAAMRKIYCFGWKRFVEYCLQESQNAKEN